MAGRSSKGKLRGMLSDKVRVWWPPTKDRKKTDFSGMYWPAKVVKHTSEGYEVQYDNGDKELVLSENVSPFTPPINFGEEGCTLQVGEFCEVFNGSKTDPAAWVGKVKRIAKRGTYTVSYPFHDAPDERVKPEMLRRARVYDSHTRQWALITPAQEWEDGEVSSPVELEQCDEETLADILGTEARVLVTRRGSQGQGQGPTSPLAGRLTAMRQQAQAQAQAAASSKKEASTSGPAAAARRTRTASASDEQTGDSARSGKRPKKEETARPAGPLPASSEGNPIAGYITHHVPGLGPVLIPLSSVMAGASGALSSHVNATLRSLGQQGGGGAPPPTLTLTLSRHTCCPTLHSFQPPLHTTCRSRQPWTKSCSRRQYLHRPQLVQSPQLGGAGRGEATPMWGPPPWPLWCPMSPRWHPHTTHQPS